MVVPGTLKGRCEETVCQRPAGRSSAALWRREGAASAGVVRTSRLNLACDTLLTRQRWNLLISTAALHSVITCQRWVAARDPL